MRHCTTLVRDRTTSVRDRTTSVRLCIILNNFAPYMFAKLKFRDKKEKAKLAV